MPNTPALQHSTTPSANTPALQHSTTPSANTPALQHSSTPVRGRGAPRTWNIIFCGVGGQGVLKAAEVCGIAAMRDGHRVRKAEVHGMSQRGGSVESHLRFGPRVHSPLVPMGQADYLVCFDATEGQRYSGLLKKGGVNFTKFLAEAQKMPDKRFANTFFLGILSQFLPLTREAWLAALEQSFARAVPENKEAFKQGAEYDLE